MAARRRTRAAPSAMISSSACDAESVMAPSAPLPGSNDNSISGASSLPPIDTFIRGCAIHVPQFH